MHEYSIVQSLLDLCEKNAKEQEREKVVVVTVKIGILSGVEPQLLQIAFDTFKQGTIAEDALFNIDVSNPILHCNACGYSGVIPRTMFECPSCETVDIRLEGGDELLLMRLELV